MSKNKLHNIKNSGFKTPNDYFDNLEDSIMNQINLSEKIEDTGFKTPDNYFESLEDNLLDKVSHKPKVISMFTKRNLIYASSIAAALVIMLSVYFNRNEITFDNLETVSIENYLYDEGFDTYEIASLLTEEELSTDNFVDSQLSDELIENYLIENTTIEDLILE